MADEDELIHQRRNILKRIKNVTRNEGYRDEQNLLQQLQQDYNDIMDILDQSNVYCDPLDKLPPEIFGNIVYASRRFGSIFKPNRQFDDTLNLTLVSKRWRDFVLGTPMLWTDVKFYPQEEDSVQKVFLGLELSRGMPISLDLTLMDNWDAILPLLLGHRQRIQSLSISRHYSLNIESIVDTLEQLFPIPNLKQLRFADGEPGRIARWVLERCNSLESITGTTLPEDTCQLPSAHELQYARISTNLDRFLDIECNMPRLRRVDLDLPGDQDRTEQSQTLNKAPLLPLNWQGLTCSNTSPQSIRPLSGRLINLTYLAITIQITTLHQLLVHLHRIPRLQRLVITLDDFSTQSVKDDLFAAKEILPHPGIEFLQVTSRINGSEDDEKHLSRVLVTIPDALMRAMPELDQLVLLITPPLDFSEFYDWGKLTRLSKLSLGILRRRPLERHYILPPSVRDVQLSGEIPSFIYFSGSGVTRLVAMSAKTNHRRQSGVQIEGEKWPRLRSLSTYWYCIDGQGHRYTHLSELELSVGPYPRYNSWIFGVHETRFCHKLAKDPTHFPSLECLSLRGLPQWDILLIMIKRRNIIKLQGVRPLKVLRIRSMYPEELKGPISNLLRRRFSDWPSLYELSIHGALELIRNPLISGCKGCLRCLRVCPAKGDVVGEDPIPTTGLDLPPYPHSDKEILLTWQARNRACLEILHRLKRESSCGALEEDEMATLTEDSV